MRETLPFWAYKRNPWFLIALLSAWYAFGCCLACQASDPASRARAALAIAAVQKPWSGCACTSPANCVCGDYCSCANCAARNHPTTCRADDGGPSWTWDAQRGDWFRVVPADSPAQAAPPPVLFQPAAPAFQPATAPYFGPSRMSFRGGVGGGGRRGGC